MNSGNGPGCSTGTEGRSPLKILSSSDVSSIRCARLPSHVVPSSVPTKDVREERTRSTGASLIFRYGSELSGDVTSVSCDCTEEDLDSRLLSEPEDVSPILREAGRASTGCGRCVTSPSSATLLDL